LERTSTQERTHGFPAPNCYVSDEFRVPFEELSGQDGFGLLWNHLNPLKNSLEEEGS